MGKQIAKPPTFEFVKFIAILRSPLGFRGECVSLVYYTFSRYPDF
ncbi:MAG TPA: hypothetical protein V6C90_16630 [Coleofasciculaceae cyanobacterium]